MNPFTPYRIILLLFIFSLNNLYAVKPTTTKSAKMEAIVNISPSKQVSKDSRKAMRKSRLVERFKKKITRLFEKNKTEKSSYSKENLETKRHGLAVASMVLGIAGIPFMFIGIGFLFALLALIFGIIAKSKINNSGGFYTGKGMATAGIILGIIPLVLFIVLLFLIFTFGVF